VSATAAAPARRPWAFWLDVAVKVLFVGLLAFGAFSGLEQFEGKAFGWRLVFYPLAGVVVPLGWWLAGRPQPYPYALDILLVSPFLVDVLGNVFDLYDTIEWWDDLNHFVNWALLSLAVVWELGEYVAFIRNSDELDTAYTDTLGDMLLGLSGSIVAAAATATVLARNR
jgi:hypothetical protein